MHGRSGGCGGHGPTVILIDSLWGPKTRKHAIFSFGVYIHAMGDLSLSRTHSSPSEPSASSALRVGFVRPASGENKTFGRGMGHPGANPFANGFRDRRCGGTCCGQRWTVGLVPPPRRPKLTSSQLSGHGRRSDKMFQKTWINILYIFNSWGGTVGEDLD